MPKRREPKLKEYTFMVGEIGDWLDGISDEHRHQMKRELRSFIFDLFDGTSISWTLGKSGLDVFKGVEDHVELDEEHHHRVIDGWLTDVNTALSGRKGYPGHLFIDRTSHRMVKCCHYAGKIWTSCRMFPLLYRDHQNVVNQWTWPAKHPRTEEIRPVPLYLQVTWVCVDMTQREFLDWWNLADLFWSGSAEDREKLLGGLA